MVIPSWFPYHTRKPLDTNEPRNQPPIANRKRGPTKDRDHTPTCATNENDSRHETDKNTNQQSSTHSIDIGISKINNRPPNRITNKNIIVGKNIADNNDPETNNAENIENNTVNKYTDNIISVRTDSNSDDDFTSSDVRNIKNLRRDLISTDISGFLPLSLAKVKFIYRVIFNIAFNRYYQQTRTNSNPMSRPFSYSNFTPPWFQKSIHCMVTSRMIDFSTKLLTDLQ